MLTLFGFLVRNVLHRFVDMSNEAIIYKDTILYDRRYRKEYSDKSFSSSMGQKVNRHWRTKNVNEDKIGYKIDRSIEQRNERRMKRN